MQHSRPPNFPPFSSFKHHRSSIDQTRFRVNLTLPKPIAAFGWASLPTPPMSGSPPPEPPAEFPQIAGRRRKRSETPPVTTVAASSAITATPPTPFEQTAQSALTHGRSGYGESVSQGGLYAPIYAPPPPPVTYGSSSSMGATSSAVGEMMHQPGQISPRATRKTKAHVASACINCKKKHLRCDNARPCRRCVQSGKEDSCVDVEHKKRGRPPLKPDEPSSRRPFESGLSSLSGHPSDPSRRMTTEPSSYPPGQGYPRSFRPLQALPPYDPSRSQMRPGLPYQMYAQPTISPSPSVAMGTFIPSARPYSYAQSLSSGQSSTQDLPSAIEPPRAVPQYGGGYSYPPIQGPTAPLPPQAYSNPIFPRTTLPPPPPPTDPYASMTGPSSLQLPPIRQSLQESPMDPTIARPQSQPTTSQEQSTVIGTTRQPGAKRPKMDIQGILGPRSD